MESQVLLEKYCPMDVFYDLNESFNLMQINEFDRNGNILYDVDFFSDISNVSCAKTQFHMMLLNFSEFYRWKFKGGTGFPLFPFDLYRLKSKITRGFSEYEEYYFSKEVGYSFSMEFVYDKFDFAAATAEYNEKNNVNYDLEDAGVILYWTHENVNYRSEIHILTDEFHLFIKEKLLQYIKDYQVRISKKLQNILDERQKIINEIHEVAETEECKSIPKESLKLEYILTKVGDISRLKVGKVTLLKEVHIKRILRKMKSEEEMKSIIK